ncbi:hypothetical protein J6590_032867 [Homalodisca vitripennis]|nr:hypothetical protein J6590_032867 [Homalodisca vitripennis]
MHCVPANHLTLPGCSGSSVICGLIVLSVSGQILTGYHLSSPPPDTLDQHNSIFLRLSTYLNFFRILISYRWRLEEKLDKNLNWNEYVSNIYKKMNTVLYAVIHIKWTINVESA